MGAKGVNQWLLGMQHAEICMNAVFSIIAPDLYSSGLAALGAVKEDPGKYFGEVPKSRQNSWDGTLENTRLWPSVFSGLSVIANRETPSHRDVNGHHPWYDLLCSAGFHERCILKVVDLEATFSYKPGTLIGICGRTLRHKVKGWEGMDRLCIAHFMRFGVMDRMDLPIQEAEFVNVTPLLKQCGVPFVQENWHYFTDDKSVGGYIH